MLQSPDTQLREMSTSALGDWQCMQQLRKDRHPGSWIVRMSLRNMCNISGHVARQCPKSEYVGERGGGVRDSGYRDIVCRS
ncbi:hypothetical protein IFM89_035542 [Coptis chinensis]|uniref:Uncharacterized protein n=1 Tax=Coptis chinensis TaxID=261450 RepID=A0A835HAY7_9MAGN|nr:hypothetical protein IFM89_035542 [Coptis chinensis]